MELWYLPAVRDPVKDTGPMLSGPWRGVIHSTEGASYAGARGAYGATGNFPHFTASFETSKFEIWQHLPLTSYATALVHPTNGPETNRLACIQIEVVGFAEQSPGWPIGLLDGLRTWMEWIEAQTGVQALSPQFLPYPMSAGQTLARMSATEWMAFHGWCGHEHVPGNTHGDPGALNMAYLLTRSPAVPALTFDYQEVTVKTSLLAIPLDANGDGWFEWNPGLGRDPIIVGVTQQGPFPPVDGYWPQTARVNISAQPRGGNLCVCVRGGTPGTTVDVWAAVA